MSSSSKWQEEQKNRKEIERLKKENEALKKSARGGETSKPRKAKDWAAITAVILLVVGLVIVPFALSAVWVNQQVVNTDAYVNTVAPLSQNPVIQNSVANFATTELFKLVNVKKMTSNALPPNAQFLAIPLTNAVRTLVHSAALKVTQSNQFTTLWTTANRAGHTVVIDALNSGSGKNVTVDVSQLISSVKSSLGASGITIFNSIKLIPGNTKITIFKSQQVAAIRSYMKTLRTLATLLPLLALACIAGAIILSKKRRMMVMWTGYGIIIGMAFLFVAILIGRSYYLGAIPTRIPQNFAAAVFDTIINSFRIYIRSFVLIGLLIVGGTLITGPSQWAINFRVWVNSSIKGQSKKHDFGTAGAWIAEHKQILRIAGVVIALGALLLLNQLTPAAIMITVLLLLIYLGCIEYFGVSSRVAHKPA